MGGLGQRHPGLIQKPGRPRTGAMREALCRRKRDNWWILMIFTTFSRKPFDNTCAKRYNINTTDWDSLGGKPYGKYGKENHHHQP